MRGRLDGNLISGNDWRCPLVRRTALVSCLVFVLPAVAPAQTAVGDEKPGAAASAPDTSESPTMEQPMVGDRWTYEVRDEVTGTLRNTNTETITDVTSTEISTRTETVGASGLSFFVYDNLWNQKNSGPWKYSPNDGTGVKLPLKVGGRWTAQTTAVNGGATFRRSVSSKVLGEETVTTDAGAFHTFKIETVAIARSIQDPTKKSQATVTSWYAPSVNHWVKRSWKVEANGHVTQNISSVLIDCGRR
jgi:hypothetical protein